MKFQYSEKKVKLPGNVHAYAEKKVMKLARFFEEDAEALIVFSVEKNQNNVELTVHGAGTWFRASESTSDMFASIDAAVATIEGQIRRSSFVKTQIIPRDNGDYSVVMALDDEMGNLMTLELLAPNQRQAVRLGKLFEKKAEAVYNLTMAELLDDEDEADD